MSTTKKRLAAITAAGVLFAVGAGGVAIASWSGSGTGSAFAKATALPTGPTPSAPTTATQTSTSITVTWAKVQYTGTSTDVAGYVVTRYKAGVAEAIGGNCTGTLSSTTTTCNDTVGGVGTYRYSVTPKNNAWTGTESALSGTVTVVPAASHSFTVTPASTTPTAGTPFNVTITAKNNGSTDSTYTGTKTLDWSGPSTIGAFSPTYPTNPVTFTNGVATVPVTLVKAESTTLTVTDHGDSTYTGTSASLTVSRASVQLTLTCPASQKKSTAAAVTLGRPAADAFGNSTTASAVTATVSATNAASGSGSQNITIASGATSANFSITMGSAASGTTTVTTDAPTGYTAAASCGIEHTN